MLDPHQCQILLCIVHVPIELKRRHKGKINGQVLGNLQYVMTTFKSNILFKSINLMPQLSAT